MSNVLTMTKSLSVLAFLLLVLGNFTLAHKEQRIYCLIKTFGQNLATRALIIHQTWASRCDKHTFLTATNLTKWNITSLPIMNLADVNDNYLELSIKVFDAVNFILQEGQPFDFDWLFIADDDTYVMMEHLRSLLDHSPAGPRAFGHLFIPKSDSRGHFSGGAGYVMNTAALQRMLPNLQTTCAPWYLPGPEDVHISRCLQYLNVTLDGALDGQHHRFYPLTFLDLYEENFPQWFSDYNPLPTHAGFDCCSSQSISFHYVSTEWMNLIEWARYVHEND